MRNRAVYWPSMIRQLTFLMALAAMSLVFHQNALALNLTVTDQAGNTVDSFRWLVEEDLTFDVDPTQEYANPAVPGTETLPGQLAFNFHRSHMPVAAKGNDVQASDITLDPAKRYYVSVLPDKNFTMGGAQIAAGQAEVTVVVNPLPLPTAQITIFIFNDNMPINAAADQGEVGLEGFKIRLEDGGGRYGASAGQQMMDVYGNPLGTTYTVAPDGTALMDVMGSGVVETGPDGSATLKNLAPGKYGIYVIPPTDTDASWEQTTTLEGKKIIDAWVKANEPPYFAEFGPPGWHVAIGFIDGAQPDLVNPSALTGSTVLTGTIVNNHLSRPPNYAFNAAEPFPHTTPWVGLNDVNSGLGLYAVATDENGVFTIPNVPEGLYELAIWDENVDLVIAYQRVAVAGDGTVTPPITSVDFKIPVFNWFHRMEHYVFADSNENGFRDAGEVGIPEVGINLRWRDGTIYQAFATDSTGAAPFDEVFPFFNWLVAEVDFARLKATGATMIVDNGGPTDPTDPWSFEGVLSPQPQPENGNLSYRVETGPVLTQAFQGFLGQTNVIEWGKTAYAPGENGGISGMVYYATTRAESDPRYAGAEVWEPGIPDVQVALYIDADYDGVIDSLTGGATPVLSDIDYPPLGNFPGDEDIDRAGNGIFDYGDAIQVTYTDSWDASLPEGCPPGPANADPFYDDGKCYDGLRNWNQIRPGVFDGGFAFDSYYPGGAAAHADPTTGALPELGAVSPLPSGSYIVESKALPNYETAAEEHRNVDFGEEYVPSPLLLPPACVGDDHQVPTYLTLFPKQEIESIFAGEIRPLCDLKAVVLTSGKNAAAEFFQFTEVPIAGHIVGIILNDLANEFDPTSPNFGEKYAPPFVPISIQDWQGTEIARIYSDEYGTYDALVPSTFTNNLPQPSGMSPSMLTVCLNDPGYDPDTGLNDPFYNPQYSRFCYTFQYMPGTTTYLDTPVVPVAAFAGSGKFPLDCEYPDETPTIYSVNGTGDTGPYVDIAPGTITIRSEGFGAGGIVEVLNPNYEGAAGTPLLHITRDFGFGAVAGTVTVGGVELTIDSWGAGEITATVPDTVTTGQLVVTRDNGNKTLASVTLTVGGGATHVSPSTTSTDTPIQDAIDAATEGDLIVVAPGTYFEPVILWKPLRLQGWGPGSTLINASNVPAETRLLWRAKVKSLYDAGEWDEVPGQEILFGGLEPDALFTEEGPGVIVLGKSSAAPLFADNPARIDGFSITGADFGGGVFVNGFATNLNITNNKIFGNQGFWGGGIRLGHPFLTVEDGGGDITYASSFNENIIIRNNHITRNAGQTGVGGGVSICTGADNYQVTANFICGNFTQGDGAGIGQLGFSDNGTISQNLIAFNQSFNQGQSRAGGGIYIGGGAPQGIDSLSEGTGSVTIASNHILGNLAGAGDGGGIRLERINGRDVVADTDPATWNNVMIVDNEIVNNVAAMAGGAISMQDVASASILNNIIARNDSTATASGAFVADSVPQQSLPQVAGIVSYGHSDELAAAVVAAAVPAPAPEGSAFADPVLAFNVIWENRSMFFEIDPAGDLFGTPPVNPVTVMDAAPPYNDLGVVGATGMLNPQSSILTPLNAAAYPGDGGSPNTFADPGFVNPYFNTGTPGLVVPEAITDFLIAAAFDEGGNFIDVRFWPLTLNGFDYTRTDDGIGPAGTVGPLTITGSAASSDTGTTSNTAAVSAAGENDNSGCFLNTLFEAY